MSRLTREPYPGHQRHTVSNQASPHSRGWLLLFLCLIPAAAATGATNEFADYSLDELMNVDIATSPSFLPTRPEQAPGTVYAFDRRDFERLGVRRIEQLFRFIPGFQTNQYRKRHTSIWSRGLVDRDNNKMMVMVDGTPRRRLYYGQFSLGEQIALDRVERVEVILGPASSLYGANAFGGVISISTRIPDHGGERRAILEGGDNQRVGGSIWFGDGDTRLFARALDQHAPFRENRQSFIGVQAEQPLDEIYANLYLSRNLSDGLTFSLDLYRNEYPFVFIPPTQDAAITERAISADLSYAAGEPQGGRTEAALYYNGDRSQEQETERASRRDGYRENQHADLFGAYLRHMRGFGDHAVLFGAEWQREEGIDFSYTRWFHYAEGFLATPDEGSLLANPDFSTDNLALYLQDVWRMRDDLTLTLGARYDRFDAFNDHFNYRAAMVWMPSRDESWKLLYGTAIRTPSYREAMKSLESDFSPPPLEAEELKSLEVSYHRHIRGLDIGVTLYQNTMENFITETPTPDGGDEYFANSDGGWKMRGVELLAEYHLNPSLYLHAGLSHLRARWDRGGEPPYLARHTASIAVYYSPDGGHHLGLSASYTGRRDDGNGFSEDDSDAYWLVNLHANGGISPELHYQIGVDNLFNAKIFDPAGDFGGRYNSQQSGREIWGRLIWNF